MEFRIEVAHDLEACREAVLLQRETWGDAVTVPENMLLATLHAGAFLAIARVGGAVAGFVYSFLGVRDGRPLHHSHMLAVLPPYRGGDIARALKAAQRDHCLAAGIDLVTWTMDPLESRNARFNLVKLGARAISYMPDYYGEMPDKLNAGVATDRFLIEWRLREDRVPSSGPLRTVEREVPYLLAADGDRPGAEAAVGDAAAYLVSAPWDVQSLKARDVGLAHAWREAHRRTLAPAIVRGYAAVDFPTDAGRGAYLLRR